ncbi:TonB-dependent receptor [Shewanella sp. VB17]|uniref:OmpA family protein n=1 Tax=Shewanella sp. VB17 TaxID=2739432 RepID=UPI001564EEC4|nr:OmpA family protein [Shewanella sp. VB17]NRD71905.1 TonB-dependent receptor [Shewanella sp. VB17]
MEIKKFVISILFFYSSVSYLQANTVENINYDEKGELISENQNNEHVYVGLRGGWTNFQDACSNSNSECNNDTFGYGLYTGYQFTSWFALEAALTDYGSIDASYGFNNVSTDIWGSELTGVFSYAISSNFDTYLRVGAAYQDIEKTSSWENELSSNEWDIVSAVGLDYRLSPNLSIRGEYQFIDGIGDNNVMQADMHFISLGLSYHFNQQKKSVTTYPPQKTNIELAPIAVANKIPSHTSVLFLFDSTKFEVNEDLDKLAIAIKQHTSGMVTITGYTDSLGSEKYNQQLSEARAHSIADYFIRQGINPLRLIVLGQGENSPIAQNTTSEGRVLNRRVNINF